MENPVLDLIPTLHYFLSIGTTCLLNGVSNGRIEDDLALKEESSLLLSRILNKFADKCPSLWGRLIEILVDGAFGDCKMMATRYGGLLGLLTIDRGFGREIIEGELNDEFERALKVGLADENDKEKMLAMGIAELLTKENVKKKN
jgi:hypothetical protein